MAGGGGECSRASIRKINVSKERGEQNVKEPSLRT